MELEELFCELYPDYSVNGKPLSPYFDLFERGYEESENRIEELEKDKQYFSDSLDKQIEATLKLQQENAELKSECRRCIYTDSPCILSDYGKDKNGICDHFKDVFDENAELDCQKNRNKYCYSCANATERCFRNEIGCPCGKYKSYKDENTELKADNDARKFAMAMSEKVEKQLREENAELNEKLSEQKQYTAFKCNEFVKKKEVYEREHFFLNKAKEIIKRYLSIGVGGKITQNYLDVTKEAEQFLNSEVEK